MAEENSYRTRKWMPDMVLLRDATDSIMIDPENEEVPLEIKDRIRLIVVRNLCRRTLQKNCTQQKK